jgi:hypothetical protein
MLLVLLLLKFIWEKRGEADHIVQYSKYWVIYRNSILMLG